MREIQLTGLDALAMATQLLQRIRRQHPTHGLFEAADLQWWWAQGERASDAAPQLFWLDGDDEPIAAAYLTAWSYGTQVDPFLPADATPDLTRLVMQRGVEHATDLGFEGLQLEADPADGVLRGVLTELGFARQPSGMAETWLDVADRPALSPLADGYRLLTRCDAAPAPHHLASRNGEHVDERLAEISLYRPDLDLVVVEPAGEPAAYALFWFDPASETALIEPVRTEDAHQRRGLSRHVLTVGIQRVVTAGARRVKIIFEADNPGSSTLYPGLGFQVVRRTDSFSR